MFNIVVGDSYKLHLHVFRLRCCEFQLFHCSLSISAQSTISREPSVHFKEVNVKQLDKNALYNMPIQGY